MNLYIAKGKYIDLFDPQLPVLEIKEVSPGTQALLIDMDRVDKKKKSQVLASSCRIYDEKSTAHTYSFTGKAPVNTIRNDAYPITRTPKELHSHE